MHSRSAHSDAARLACERRQPTGCRATSGKWEALQRRRLALVRGSALGDGGDKARELLASCARGRGVSSSRTWALARPRKGGSRLVGADRLGRRADDPDAALD